MPQMQFLEKNCKKGNASEGKGRMRETRDRAGLLKMGGADTKRKRKVQIPKGSRGRVKEAGRSTDWV